MSEVEENPLVLCAFGTMLLSCALTSAIFLGTSYLIPSQPYTDISGTVGAAGFFLLAGSVIGGYLISYGFLKIVKGSNGPASGTQEGKI